MSLEGLCREAAEVLETEEMEICQESTGTVQKDLDDSAMSIYKNELENKFNGIMEIFSTFTRNG